MGLGDNKLTIKIVNETREKVPLGLYSPTIHCQPLTLAFKGFYNLKLSLTWTILVEMHKRFPLR